LVCSTAVIAASTTRTVPAVDGRGWPLLFLLRAMALGSWRLLLLLWPAALHGLRWQLLLRPPALGSWRLPDGCLLLPPLRLTARGGLQLLLLLRPAVLSLLLPLIKSAALHPRLRLSQLLFLTLLLMLLQLIAACWSMIGCR